MIIEILGLRRVVEPETWDRVLYNDRSLVILIFILDRFNFIDPFILVLKKHVDH